MRPPRIRRRLTARRAARNWAKNGGGPTPPWVAQLTEAHAKVVEDTRPVGHETRHKEPGK